MLILHWFDIHNKSIADGRLCPPLRCHILMNSIKRRCCLWHPPGSTTWRISSKHSIVLDTGLFSRWYENTTSSTKPEVYSVSQRRSSHDLVSQWFNSTQPSSSRITRTHTRTVDRGISLLTLKTQTHCSHSLRYPNWYEIVHLLLECDRQTDRRTPDATEYTIR